MPLQTPAKFQRGSVVLAMLAMFMLVAGYMLVKAFNDSGVARDKISDDSLVKAKEALIGFAATYRDSHVGGPVFGYLPCPAPTGNGVSVGPCGAANISRIGLFPWSTLGLPPLRDSSGECLWYAVSGTFKDNPANPRQMNWDTPGQLIINDTAGNVQANDVVAVIFAPRGPILTQNRNPAGVTECRTNNLPRNYLDGADPLYAGVAPAALATSTLTMATAASLQAASFQTGANNDRLIWITAAEIFDRVKHRRDIHSPAYPANPNGEINNLLASIRACMGDLAALPAPTIINFTNMTEMPGSAVGGIVPGRIPIGFLDAIPNCRSTAAWGIPFAPPPPPPPLPPPTNWTTWWTGRGLNFYNRWQDNLLYARCNAGQCLNINGSACEAVLVFSGERNNAAGQIRNTVVAKNVWSNYLEGNLLSLFNSGAPTNIAGVATTFTVANWDVPASADVAVCLNRSGSGTQVTFASNFGNFVTAGTGVTTNAGTQTVTVSPSAGGNGGCFWYPTAVPLNGKKLRAYYSYTFTDADPVGGVDHGNGFSLSLLRGDLGAPATCGTQNNMGVLNASDPLGLISIFVETDVHRDGGDNDPVENHTAIMMDGNFNHPAGSITLACNGTARGCRHTPADKFEESPVPLAHNQRVEIHTGYTDAACSVSGAGSYALIKTWVDCAACTDTSVDFAPVPTVVRCIALDPALNSFYFGFTGGFRTGGATQGVVIQNLDLRTQ